MKRRALFFALIVSFATLFASVARADVIAGPRYGDFLYAHQKEVQWLNKSFYANGKNGSLTFYEAPGSKNVTATIENGEIIYFTGMYDYEGKMWGISYDYGWAPMSQLLFVYDYHAFADEYKNEINTPGDEDKASLKTGDTVVAWSWPGSGVKLTVGVLMKTAFYNTNQAFRVYNDGQGRRWAYVRSLYCDSGNYNDVWVCLSDPTNENIPAFNPAPEPAPLDFGDTNASGGLSPLVLAIILVAAVAVWTALLIRVFWKPKRKG